VHDLASDDEPDMTFVRDTMLTPIRGEPERLLAFDVFDNDIWMVFPDRVEMRTLQADGTYRVTAPRVLRFPDWGSPSRILVEEDGVAWIGSGQTLFRYDPRSRL